MSASPLHSAFHYQADACLNLGSPFMGRLCSQIGDRLPDVGRVWETLREWKGDVGPYGASIPLRLAGALHALVLEGCDARLTAVYPPNHDQVTDEQLWNAVCEAVASHADFILKRLQSAPQTNEVRRSGLLLPGFLKIADLTGINQFVMSELGASAGLNMHWDKFHYQYGAIEWGDSNALTRLAPDWSGSFPPSTDLNVLSRSGCDLNPVDLTDKAQRRHLMSYLWPDQSARMSRTEAAIKLAMDNSVKVDQSDAIDWLSHRLDNRHDGAVHVIYHTIAWQYFPDSKKLEGEELLMQAGSHATKDAPLAWLRLEADGKSPGAALTLTLWPTGETRLLARADYHGRWIEWQ